MNSTTKRIWVFDWRLLVFSGCFLPLLLGLGFWQLDRGQQKQTMLANWEIQRESSSWAEQLRTGVIPGQPLLLAGHYDAGIHWLLDNRTREGMAGYEVLSLFHPLEGAPVIVNRGWLRAPTSRQELPRVITPSALVQLDVRVADYPIPPVLAEEPEPSGWPRRVQKLDQAQAAQVVQGLPEVIVRLENRQQPGAFLVDWAPDMMGPQTHYGYAVQWFGLAIALVILTLVASRRRPAASPA